MFSYLSKRLMHAINNISYLNIFENEKIHNDIDIIRNNISNRPVNLIVTISGIISALVTILSITISMIFISVYLPLLALILGIVIFYTSSKSQSELWSGTLIRNFQSRMMNYIFGLTVDRTAMQEIRIYNADQFLEEKFLTMHSNAKRIMNKVRLKIAYLFLFSGLSMIIISSLMAFNVLYLAVYGAISASSLVFLLQGIQNIQLSTRSVSEQLGWLSGHLLFFEKYFEYTAPKIAIESKNERYSDDNDRIYSISLKNCSFSYGDKIIINNINLELKENDIVSIVGKNGAGKTTLARILMGLIKPTSGELLINNIPVEEYGIKKYWEKCSFVPQLFAQFKFTLHESIFMGKEYNTNNSIINRDFFTEGLPTKDSQLGKEFSGTDLSGGQWQKIAIMRAIFNNENTDMLFFDEPTSAIDPLVEEEVYNLIEEISKNKIAVYITHRMSTVTHANRIILLNDNHIVADGKHEDLYSTNTLYRKMFDAQAKRFMTA